jgi:hypothetical protein
MEDVRVFERKKCRRKAFREQSACKSALTGAAGRGESAFTIAS